MFANAGEGGVFHEGRAARSVPSGVQVPAHRGPAPGHPEAGGRAECRHEGADFAGRHRLGQDLHHGKRHCPGEPAHPGAGPQQDPGRPAVLGVPGVLPGQRGGVLRLLLRLLPAGGLHPPDGHLHREGLRHQRRDRQAAPQRHQRPFRAPGRDHRGVGLLHLLPGRPHRLPDHGHLPAPGAGAGPGRAFKKAGGAAVRAQRRKLYPQQVPGAGGRGGDLPGGVQRQGGAGGVLRGRDRPADGV